MKYSLIISTVNNYENILGRKPYILTAFLLLFIVLLSSCDIEAELSYIIKNNTNEQIKVIIDYYFESKNDTINISKNEQKTIAIYGQGLNSVSYYKEEGEKVRYFNQVDVFKADTIKSVTDFLETSQWEYIELGAHMADYILTVNDDDF